MRRVAKAANGLIGNEFIELDLAPTHPPTHSTHTLCSFHSGLMPAVYFGNFIVLEFVWYKKVYTLRVVLALEKMNLFHKIRIL